MKSHSDRPSGESGYTQPRKSLLAMIVGGLGAGGSRVSPPPPPPPKGQMFSVPDSRWIRVDPQGIWHSRFEFGQIVQRKNSPNGNPPPYRFRGIVCGSYFNPQTGEPGVNVASFAEPGCVQLFPDYMMESA